jgi:60 kDa SS-A/Ro ribonucleoprotein
MSYRDLYSTRATPQTEKAKPEQVKNSAGGFVFSAGDWKRLDRFLVLGSEQPTYYASARQLTVENAEAVRRCIDKDGIAVVGTATAVSIEGRAPKNDPALFVLAMCASFGDTATRRAALSHLPLVARTGTHLFHFAQYVEGFRGWGRALRRGVAEWYNGKSAGDLAYQAVKYQQRDGWSHADLLKLSHPKADNEEKNLLYQYILGKEVDRVRLPLLVDAFEQAKTEATRSGIARLIREHGLTREMIPTQWLNEIDVWAALLEAMPLTAMVRNLGKMTSIGLIAPLNHATDLVATRLMQEEYIKKSRLHPLSILVALKTYQQGKGDKGKLTWHPVARVVDALDNAFYLAFGNVKPTGKRTVLALDISGSMGQYQIAGMPITPREASAAMAMVTARVEPVHAFFGFSTTYRPLSISPRQRLDDVIRAISGLPFSGTDASLPMLHAMKEKVVVDAFIVYTDNETWAGSIHPFQALRQYRERMGVNAKLITVGMTSTGFSIADPDDEGMLDVVGFDTATPEVMGNFLTS